MQSENNQSFISLVRLGINSQNIPVLVDNWDYIKVLADKQGLLAIIIDSIDKMPEENRPPKLQLLEWIGEMLATYEQRYIVYENAISSLAAFYNQHGFKMMVLKGYSCSLDWPKPQHRPCGDIDIWQFGQQKKADKVLFYEKGIKIDNSHHHHTVFNWMGFTIENHYDFVNIHHSQSNAEIETLFKELGQDDSYFVVVNGEKVYLPSPNLHALFLLRHSMIEFVASSISLRHVLDWAFFIEKHSSDIDWEWLENTVDKYHMNDYYNCLNAICVYDLGFESAIFNQVSINTYQKDLVLKEILNPAIPNIKPKRILPRVIWKFRRWKANQWKHKLCYKESMWSFFWRGVWNHLLKPASI